MTVAVAVMKMNKNKKTMISIKKLIQLWKEVQIQKEFLRIQQINRFKILSSNIQANPKDKLIIMKLKYN